MRKHLFIVFLLSSVLAFSQNARNFIQPIEKEGFEVDSILSMRDDRIIYLRAGTEFDIEKSIVSFVEHSILGRIDVTSTTPCNKTEKNSFSFPEPEFIGEAYIVDLDKNEFIKMERAIGQVQTKDQLMGLETKLYVKPKKSNVRVKTGVMNVIVRVSDTNEDPNSFIKVSRFEVGSTRKLSLARQNELTGIIIYGGRNDQELEFSYKKYGQFSFWLSFTVTKAGEYCISLSNPNKVDGKQSISCFGAD